MTQRHASGRAAHVRKEALSDHEQRDSGIAGALLGALPQLKALTLPSAVLLPGAELRLHAFDPRHRALVYDAVATDRVLAVVMLVQQKSAEGAPSAKLRPIAGAGVIEREQRLSNGACDLVVRGVSRVRIRRVVHSERPYRVVEAQPVEESSTGLAAPVELRRMTLELAATLPERERRGLTEAATRVPEAGRLCDLAAAALFDAAELRQAVLEQIDLRKRLDLVLAELGRLSLARRGGRGLPV